MKKFLLGVTAVAMMALAVAPPAAADQDTAFADELHTYGIYGQKDYNAWIGKITCKRIAKGVDHTAYDSAQFVHNSLNRGDASTEQAYKFLALGLRTYCPDKLPLLDQAANR